MTTKTSEALGLLISIIKSGESWSDHAQQAVDEARIELSAQAEQLRLANIDALNNEADANSAYAAMGALEARAAKAEAALAYAHRDTYGPCDGFGPRGECSECCRLAALADAAERGAM